MARYIDADKVMEEIRRIGGHNLCEWHTIGVKALIDRQSTADVVEVKHGKWKIYPDEHEICASEFVCSVCKESFCSSDLTDEQFFEMMKYCPNCGAKMDGEKALKEREKE